MSVFFYSFSIFLIILSLLPFIKNQHWAFRVPDFLRLHTLLFQVLATIGMLIFIQSGFWFWLIVGAQFVLMAYHAFLFWHFTGFYKKKKIKNLEAETVKIISTNIYQFNKEFKRFREFIQSRQPDIFITIESNADWEREMRSLEKDYPYTEKNTLENTYGMHFYSKIPFEKVMTHHFVADDLPSIEAHFKTQEGDDFVVFAVHPPPPSPTEEETSKERDGDLLSIAKRIEKLNKPIVVIGDFNTVAWSKISSLFRKRSKLIDGRNGRGILASFHTDYWFFRIPLDLVFHSAAVFIKELKILENIGSDHYPICCVFGIDKSDGTQKEEIETLNGEEKEETEELIEEGKEETSENRTQKYT